jgi:hypothetical protein
MIEAGLFCLVFFRRFTLLLQEDFGALNFFFLVLTVLFYIWARFLNAEKNEEPLKKSGSQNKWGVRQIKRITSLSQRYSFKLFRP